jgi:hypothetical protein
MLSSPSPSLWRWSNAPWPPASPCLVAFFVTVGGIRAGDIRDQTIGGISFYQVARRSSTDPESSVRGICTRSADGRAPRTRVVASLARRQLVLARCHTPSEARVWSPALTPTRAPTCAVRCAVTGQTRPQRPQNVTLRMTLSALPVQCAAGAAGGDKRIHARCDWDQCREPSLTWLA